MRSAELLVDAFGRIREEVHAAVDGLTPADLSYRLDAEANSIAWLVWHLTRVQDDHIADAAGTQQVWTERGFVDRFGLPFDRSATGYGHGPHEVAALQVQTPSLLTDYHDAVHDATVAFVERLTDSDLDRIVDESWDPPVSLGVRLVSVIGDDFQHVGQAAFIRGIVERRHAVVSGLESDG
jgi:uncharacterized damage-inducible protein DinB